MNSTIYIIVALVIGFFLYRRFLNRNVRHITVAEVKNWMKTRRDLYLLDVRTREETARRKMKGAVCIPLHEIRSHINDLETHKQKTFIVVCASGSRSVSAVRLLRSNGFDAYSMRGGLLNWND